MQKPKKFYKIKIVIWFIFHVSKSLETTTLLLLHWPSQLVFFNATLLLAFINVFKQSHFLMNLFNLPTLKFSPNNSHILPWQAYQQPFIYIESSKENCTYFLHTTLTNFYLSDVLTTHRNTNWNFINKSNDRHINQLGQQKISFICVDWPLCNIWHSRLFETTEKLEHK